MGAEDFSAFLARTPGLMFRLGCRLEGDERKAHTPTFDLDERCLPIGVALLAQTALRIMGDG
jgi:metal-dependent amidase/aminoacylase/carboxypeptidase family protein